MPTGAQLDRIIRQFDRALAGLERAAIVRLDAALRVAARNLENDLKRYYLTAVEDAGAHALLREARARALLEQVRAALDITSGAQANAVFGRLVSDSFDLGARNALALLTPYQTQLLSLSSNAQLLVAARATQASARLAHHGQAFAMKAEELVIDGIVRGRGWGRTSAQLRRETTVTRWKAEQIVRTESVSAAHDSRAATFAENGVEYGQWNSVADAVVCGYCLERSGRVYRLTDIVMPAHPGCRCVTMPWRADWHEMGLTDDDWARAHRKEAESRSDHKPAGSKPSPFERAAGLEKAPTPVWSP